MASEQNDQPIVYGIEKKDGIILQAFPLVLYQEWARRYEASLRPHTVYSYRRVGKEMQRTALPFEVLFVPRHHPSVLQARDEARYIYKMHHLDPFHVQEYYYCRLQLKEAGYSDKQLASLPEPEQVEVVHVSSKSVPCLGVIHTARLEQDPRRFYFCERCTWVWPFCGPGPHHETLQDQGVLTMPIDPTYELPFATGPAPWRWSRRVLLHHRKLIDMREAALLLEIDLKVLVQVCKRGGFDSFEHPDDPQRVLLYIREVEDHQAYQREKRASEQDEQGNQRELSSGSD